MKLVPPDLAILAGYFALTLGVGLYFARRARRSMVDYSLSSRSMPWWIAGTAMVATTFSADTPLAVTEMVARNGVAGNWLWWSMLPSGMLTVFFFARLWRRAGVVTDVELAEMRYAGGPAAFLRAFRAAYLGLLVNILIMGWVNLGMAKVLGGTLGIPKGIAPERGEIGRNLLLWVLGIVFVYSVMFSTGGLIFRDSDQLLFFGAAMAVSGALLFWGLARERK